MEMLAAGAQAPVGPPPAETTAGVRLQTPFFYAEQLNQLATLRTVTSLVLGSLCGLLGLQGFSGFAVYLAMVSLIALGVGFGKCKGTPRKYFVGGWMALGIDQDGLLAFLLCWIGAYALAHVYV